MKIMERVIDGCYGGALLTLPWSGLGVLHWLTGRDFGGGLQVSWVLLGIAIMLTGVMALAEEGILSAFSRAPEFFRVELGLGRWWLMAVGISGLGILIARPPVDIQAAVFRLCKQMIQLGIMLAFTLWVSWRTRGEQRWRWTARMLVLGALVQVGYGAMQLVAYGGQSPWFGTLDGVFTSNPSILSGSGDLYLNNTMQHMARLRGTICEPLYLGNYLLLVLPMVVLTGWSFGRRFVVTVLLGMLFVLTWSRGAWLAGMGALVATVVFNLLKGGPKGLPFLSVRSRTTRLLLLAAAVFLAVGLAGGLDLPWRRLAQSFSTRDWSNLTRLYSMQAGWRAFLLSPVVGVGWGQFAWHFPVLVDPLGLQSQFTWPVVNNFYLKVLCETGIVGLLLLLAWIAAGVRGCVRNLKAVFPGNDARGSIIVMSVAAFAGVWSQLLTFSQYNLPHIWVVLGLIAACARDPYLRSDEGES